MLRKPTSPKPQGQGPWASYSVKRERRNGKWRYRIANPFGATVNSSGFVYRTEMLARSAGKAMKDQMKADVEEER